MGVLSFRCGFSILSLDDLRIVYQLATHVVSYLICRHLKLNSRDEIKVKVI